MATALKFDTHQAFPDEKSPEKQTHVREADGDAASNYVSPAKVLQEHLSHEMVYHEDKYPPRIVTTLVIMFCASTWVGGYMLYSMF